MKIYIAGPISACTDLERDVKIARFHRAASMLRGQGYEVFNPLDTGNNDCPGPHVCNAIERHEGQHGNASHSWSCYMKHDIMDLLKCDAICLLPRWAESRGAYLENQIATELGYAQVKVTLKEVGP